jgi:alanine-glyoxylate transaminase/serine-glyoxylate transaminase/serine-pyruvate transaminase
MNSLPERVLLGPGPSSVPARVLAALAAPTIGHLDPAFLTLVDRVRQRLQQLFQTRNDMTLAVSGTGSAGMECVLVNLIEPGDPVLVCVNGVFGGRMADVARRAGATVHTLEIPWGQAFDLEQIARAVAQHEPALVALVHAETSTGVHQPIAGLAERVHAHGGLLVIDCVTSLGGMPVCIDDWEVDAAYSGTQKCLSCPPGLSPVTLSQRALDRLARRRQPVQSWYLDLSMVQKYWGSERVYHHTAPINMLYALDEALAMVIEEGLEQRFARHRAVHALLRAGLAELGIAYLSPEGHHLPMLNAVTAPAGLDEQALRRRLLAEYDIEIGGGLGPLAGKAWRIGLMGHSASRRNVTLLLAALRELLPA